MPLRGSISVVMWYLLFFSYRPNEFLYVLDIWHNCLFNGNSVTVMLTSSWSFFRKTISSCCDSSFLSRSTRARAALSTSCREHEEHYVPQQQCLNTVKSSLCFNEDLGRYNGLQSHVCLLIGLSHPAFTKHSHSFVLDTHTFRHSFITVCFVRIWVEEQ